jgi:predicted AAA+ superfamily ATPase
MEKILFRYNPWWEKDFLHPKTLPRPSIFQEMLKNLSNKQVIFVTGLRRVGKTTLLKQTIKYLISHKKVQSKHILYVSLDDYLLAEKNILEIVEEYRKTHTLSFTQKIFLFLDEITYQKDFEQQLKNLYDNHNVKIFASSSSASILKSKKHFLTGRNSIIEVMPLNFSEYLEFKKIKLKKSDSHLTTKIFEDFMQTGGIPEFVLTGNSDYIQELVDDIIKKDIAAFYGVRDAKILQDFFLLLMERAGKIVSINKIANILDISPDSAKRYLQMFADAYLIYLVPRFGKTNERLLSAKKIYAADLGIRSHFTGFRDKGSLFENYIFLKIKKHNPTYLYQDGNEIDFIINKKYLIEVKYNSEMNDKQQALFEKMEVKNKLIIKNISDAEKIDI